MQDTEFSYIQLYDTKFVYMEASRSSNVCASNLTTKIKDYWKIIFPATMYEGI